MKKIGIVVLVMCILLSNFVPVLAAQNPSVYVTIDGKVLQFDVPPTVINGRTLVPMRAIFEELGVAVEWNATDRTITGRKGNTIIILPLDSRVATKNGEAIMMDVPATTIQGRTLVPVRFIAESLGATVNWDSKSSTVVITSPADSVSSNQQNNKKLTTHEIAEKSNAVVTIVSKNKGNEDFGSGFFISKDGKIVTNYHVIEGADKIEVVFQDETTYKGEVRILGYDIEKDIAVLKISGANYPYLNIGDPTKEKIGTDIVVIGSPLGYKNTVSTGIISGVRDGLIQITAPISPGSSGGPVLNYYGEVIGVTTSGYLWGGNLGFAVPINEVQQLDITKNLTAQEVKDIEAAYRLDNQMSYEEYMEYLYDYASTFLINKRAYIVDFDNILLEESNYDEDHLFLYYIVDTPNAYELLSAFYDGHDVSIRNMFSDIAVEIEEYYQKGVTAVIIFIADDWIEYPSSLVTNSIVSFETVKYNPETDRWMIFYPILEIISEYGEDNYYYTWFNE